MLSLIFNDEFDLHIWGRNCDRAVQRSPALEGLDQLPPLLFGDAFHAEIQAHGVEQGDIRAHRVGAVDDAADIRRDAVQRNRLRLGQHLHQFDPASRHAREEQFIWYLICAKPPSE